MDSLFDQPGVTTYDLSIPVESDSPSEPWTPEIDYWDHEHGGDLLAENLRESGYGDDLSHEDFPDGMGLAWEEITAIIHTGTHMDAPIHFARDARDAAEVPIEHLVVPLVVVDIRAKAADDPDAQLTPADLEAWEGAHGPIPEGACVAMNSGWDAKADGVGFRNADADGVMHFPGFHVEAADFLLREREVVGIAVDTLSLDYGPSADFAVHYGWLPANRWGMECVANLGALPAAGATLVAGGPKVAGATGGPSRIVALV